MLLLRAVIFSIEVRLLLLLAIFRIILIFPCFLSINLLFQRIELISFDLEVQDRCITFVLNDFALVVRRVSFLLR